MEQKKMLGLQAAYFIELLFPDGEKQENPEEAAETLFQLMKEPGRWEDRQDYRMLVLENHKIRRKKKETQEVGLTVSRSCLDFDASAIEDLEVSQYRYQTVGGKQPTRLLSGCKKKILLGDWMAAELPYLERCDLLDRWLRAAVQAFPSCAAVRFPASGRLLTPEECFADAEPPALRFLNGGASFRLFRVGEGKTPEYIADSLGMYAIGLPDVQCHFHTLRGSDVVEKLMDIAAYQFLKGDVIRDDEAVPGLSEGDWWGCRHERSILPPYRQVLDLNPGVFSAER